MNIGKEQLAAYLGAALALNTLLGTLGAPHFVLTQDQIAAIGVFLASLWALGNKQTNVKAAVNMATGLPATPEVIKAFAEQEITPQKIAAAVKNAVK